MGRDELETLRKEITRLRERVSDLESEHAAVEAAAVLLRRQSEAFAAAMDGMAIFDASQRHVFMNQAHAQIYGFHAPADLLGKTWRDLYDDAEARRIEERVVPELTSRGRWTGEAVGRRRDGSPFPQELSLAFLPDGGVICVTRDITERRRAEGLLEESRAHYRGLTELLPQGVFEADLVGRVDYANQAALEAFGLTREDVEAGVSIFQMVAPPDRPRAIKEAALVFMEGSREVELVAVRKDGSRFPVQVWASAIREGGKTTGLRGVVVDISRRKTAEEERERLIAELREALTHARTLRGLLPICAACKKIRDDTGYWNQIESYLKAHTDAEFTHGICPDCARRLYPGV